MEYIQILAAVLVQKLPILAVIGANALAACIAMGVLIELVEVVAKMTPTAKDDAAAAKAKAIKDKVIAVLELFPHANIPIAPVILKVSAIIAKGVKIALAALGAAKE